MMTIEELLMDYDYSSEKRALLALSEKLNQTLLERDAARAEADALRKQVPNWQPFNTAPESWVEILVWRNDAGTFTAFYDDEQGCWFSSFGEDLTGDLPTLWTTIPTPPNDE